MKKEQKETRQGGTDISSTVSNNNMFIVPFIFPVVRPLSLFHNSTGRADANNTWKKATIAMQQKLQTTVFSTITLCQSTTEANAHKQRRATWNALRGEEALRPPPAPPTRLFKWLASGCYFMQRQQDSSIIDKRSHSGFQPSAHRKYMKVPKQQQQPPPPPTTTTATTSTNHISCNRKERGQWTKTNAGKNAIYRKMQDNQWNRKTNETHPR